MLSIMFMWRWLWNHSSKWTCPAKITLWASTCWWSSQARATSAKLLTSFKFPKAQLWHSYWPNILPEKYDGPLQNKTFHFYGTERNYVDFGEPQVLWELKYLGELKDPGELKELCPQSVFVPYINICLFLWTSLEHTHASCVHKPDYWGKNPIHNELDWKYHDVPDFLKVSEKN